MDSALGFYYERQRLNNLFAEAARHPVIMVYAGAGYGKTSAVSDFLSSYQAITVWIQLSERDNVPARFWENFVRSVAQISLPFSDSIRELGFPDTSDKIHQYLNLVKNFESLERKILVLDDFHILEDPGVIRFAENVIQNIPIGTSVFIISRSGINLHLTNLVSKGRIFSIGEKDLCFTENEIAHFFRCLGLSPGIECLKEIMRDTKGWAFAINLIARSYEKAPGYAGYLRDAIKNNIFKIMETEVWDKITAPVQSFLVRISLIGHLSYDLIRLLAEKDEKLIAEMEEQNAYVRRDSYINAYHIHPLFLEFLRSKQDTITGEERVRTYSIAAGWCNNNSFKIDAISYYEKIGDYASIVAILFAMSVQIPPDIAKYVSEILDRAPIEAFDTVEFLAVVHMRCYLCRGNWEKSAELAEFYEARFTSLDDEDPIKIRTLSRIYFSWGYLRGLMCTMDDKFDFVQYVKKFCALVSRLDDPGIFPIFHPGAWMNRAGTSRKGSPDDYIKELSEKMTLLKVHIPGFKSGQAELARGELKFYQGNLRSAEHLFVRALVPARDYGEHGIVHLALLYSLRLSVVQGDYIQAEQAMNEMKGQLEVKEFSGCYNNYDISLAWYYYILGMPEKIPDWLKLDFSAYGHASFAENFANQAKARYCYLTRNYPPLLAYIQEMMQRESHLFGRVEMLAIEACIHYKMKDKKEAYNVLTEAYEASHPNGIIMPFIELGKDMRTLTGAALKDSVNIPKTWLENINRKAAYYAKRQVGFVLRYNQSNLTTNGITLSPRETDILHDLSHGLTRVEIAAGRDLSVNTVKMVINNIYSKLGAENLADLIRIAVKQKMI